MRSTPVAEIIALRVAFHRGDSEFVALRGVDLAIGAGEVVALVGESGSGKTLLGSCLLGLPPTGPGVHVEGRVKVCGVDMVDGRPAEQRWVRRHLLGAVFQDPLTSLDPTMRVGDQVCERGADRSRGVEAMVECGIPDAEQRFASWPHLLSGGLRQRVSIAGALTVAADDGGRPPATRGGSAEGVPALIVADEPTTALDVRVQARVIDLFASLRDDHGCSILLITHDLGVAARVADRIVVMAAGQIVESGPAADVVAHPQHAYTRRLLASRLDVAGPFGAEDAPAALPGAAPAAPADLALSLRDVVKTFPGPARRSAPVPVLHDVSLDVAAGGATALVGESGSGKSTLLRIAAGLVQATSGTVEHGEARPQMIFQDARSSLTPWLTVRRQLEERLALIGVPRASRPERVAELLTQVGLDERVAASRPRQLSGGQCQRVAIARALALQPRVLLCDEPVSALDATLAGQVVDLLDDLRRRTGVSILMVTHDLAVAKRIASRVAVMREGRILEEGSVRQVFEDPRHPYTRELLEASPSVAAAV